MSDPVRVGEVARKTRETDIRVKISLDGTGTSQVQTGIGFFDHMLTALARHGFFDLQISCVGDLEVDGHHTVEDVGICLGQAFKIALGDGSGVIRYGNAFVPMDEALVQVALDISGRPFCAADLQLPQAQVGAFDSCLAEEFFRAFAFNAGITLHIRQLAGTNTHHIIEAAFKALAKALQQAVTFDQRIDGTLSTKGSLDL
ncbi:MAG: imidazoleglycerol-phosphate dehydratase HisB [Firmicutes bacterium]|nr:imidazoleglycerol-phosphate dehydratase HisB [Bacillota bacterium]